MQKRIRVVILVILGMVSCLLLGPFLIPVPPLTDTRPPQELADPDSLFLTARGIQVHYKQAGEGQPIFILLHGFGASLFSWHKVLDPLGEQGRVLAYDRPAFGLTERPMEWGETNPYSPDFQPVLLIEWMDQLGIESAVLVGNSAGGTVAIQTALAHPERVRALILVNPAVYTGGTPSLLRPLFRLPQVDRLGPLFVRGIQARGEEFINMAWHDPSLITPEIWDGYTRPLQADNWDRALWDFTRSSRQLGLEDLLGELDLPVLVIAGDDDRIVPTGDSRRAAQDIPSAVFVELENCGHLPQEECPQAFMQALLDFIAEFDDS
jgi:pimeloyl-ACP methyl ester carboxylesterase